ncbi:IS66 family insertion sequence element accessory protein TnpB [Enterocloster clostridioformis]|nr:IS66 family insertion sequence element accessory protein TnpB [Enterocloster clostridioformis]
MAEKAEHIYLACGATDFRKQIQGLTALVSMQFQLDPYQGTNVFIFCNKRRDTIKVLRYDKNGFILASKQLLDGMRFQGPALLLR